MKKNKTLSIVLIIFAFFIGAGGMYCLVNYAPKSVQTVVNKSEKEVTITDAGIADSVEKLYDAVVVVGSYKNGVLTSSGTGFVYEEDDKYFRYLIEDDQSSKSEISKDTITTYFKKFFYTSDAGNMYLDGYYYGDSIKINRKYYELFTLDEENEILNYKLFNDNTHPDYVVNTTFSVNKFGMLLNLETSTKELEGSLCSFSEVTSIYN